MDEPVLVLLVVAALVNLAVMAALLVPPLMGRRAPFGTGEGKRSAAEPSVAESPMSGRPAGRRATELAIVGGSPDGISADGVPVGAYDRVVRIVSWVFILVAATIVAVTGLWPEAQPAIFVLLALAGIFVLLVHDLLPSASLGGGKFVVEGSVAITLAALLIVFTGRETSPFFFVFPLIVGGAALVVSPGVTVILTAVASFAYLVSVLAGPDVSATPQTMATVAVNLTAMILLAYVAMVIAREQRVSRDAAIRLSTVDPLTGLFNRTFFFAAVDREIARSARSGRGFCILMMDLDELKTINDRLGHFRGDEALRAVGEIIRERVRRIDTAARYGGDEFVVLLPETDPTGAYVLAEKIRLGVAGFALPGTELRTTLSVGVVAFPHDGRTADELLISADQAMYASKRLGKNRVMGFPVAAGGPRANSV